MDDYTFAAYIAIIIIAIHLTAICYMAFPILRLIIHRGKFERKKARRIALWNSIVLGVIFFVLNAALFESASAPTPAIIYFWINFAILAKKKEKNVIEENVEEIIEENQTETTLKVIKPERAPQLSFPDETPKVYGDYNVYGKDIAYVPPVEKTVIKNTAIPAVENEKENDTICFCRKCGNKLREGTLFCSKCGTRIQ